MKPSKLHPPVIILTILTTLTAASGAFAATQKLDEQFAKLPHFYYDYCAPWEPSPYDVTFNPKATLALAVELQKLGHEQAITQLREWAQRPDGGKIIPLCRLLFKPRAGGAFRSPRLGHYDTLPLTDASEKSLVPIAIVDGIPFLISKLHILMDTETPAREEDYLKYCETECDWNPAIYRNATDDEISSAAAKLLASASFLNDTIRKYWAPFILKQTKPPEPRKNPVDYTVMTPAERKSALEKYLDSKFDMAGVPTEREADFYEILELLSSDQPRILPRVLVCSATFLSADKARLSLFNGHNVGGQIFMKKKGRWVYLGGYWID